MGEGGVSPKPALLTKMDYKHISPARLPQQDNHKLYFFCFNEKKTAAKYLLMVSTLERIRLASRLSWRFGELLNLSPKYF